MPRRRKPADDPAAAAGAVKDAAASATAAVDEAASAAASGDDEAFEDALEEAREQIAELQEQVKWLKDNLPPKQTAPDPELASLKTALQATTETLAGLQNQVKELQTKAAQPEAPKKDSASTVQADLETPGVQGPLPVKPPPVVPDSSTPPADDLKKTAPLTGSADAQKRKFRLI